MGSANVVDLAPQLQSCILASLAVGKHATQYKAKAQAITYAEGISAGRSEEECADRQTDTRASVNNHSKDAC